METLFEIISCPICEHDTPQLHLTVPDRFHPEEEFQLVKCPQCGFVYLNPRPAAEHIGRYYAASDYDPHRTEIRSLFDVVYAAIQKINIGLKLRWLKQTVGTGRVLDVGCGTGEFLQAAQKHGFTVEGMEVNANAREYVAGQGIPVAATLDAITGSFDALTFWHVVEHIHDLSELFQHIQRLLKPNGWLIIAVPNHQAVDARAFGRFWVAYDAPRHLYHFRPRDLDQLAKHHGFELQQRRFLPFDPFYNVLLSRNLKRQCLSGDDSVSVFGDFLVGWRSFWAGWRHPDQAASPVAFYRRRASR